MKAMIFDTETTSMEEPEIMEAAWVILGEAGGDTYHHERFLPSKPITLGAMSTHHIIMEDLAGCRPSSEFSLPETDILIGHNVDFDWRAAGSPGVRRICTLALSRWLFPELDCHSQTAMLYHFFSHAKAREMSVNAHSALQDVLNCHRLLGKLMAEMERRDIPVMTWMDVWHASEEARIPIVMTFGKHKGMLIKDVPPDYKRWLLSQPDVDEYLAKALKQTTWIDNPAFLRPDNRGGGKRK